MQQGLGYGMRDYKVATSQQLPERLELTDILAGSRGQDATADTTSITYDTLSIPAALASPTPAVPAATDTFSRTLLVLTLPSSWAVWFCGAQPQQHRQAATTETHAQFCCHLRDLLQRADLLRLRWPELTSGAGPDSQITPSTGDRLSRLTSDCMHLTGNGGFAFNLGATVSQISMSALQTIPLVTLCPSLQDTRDTLYKMPSGPKCITCQVLHKWMMCCDTEVGGNHDRAGRNIPW